MLFSSQIMYLLVRRSMSEALMVRNICALLKLLWGLIW